MALKYRLLPSAREDIDAIWSYVAEDNPQAANRVSDGIKEFIFLLCAQPRMGRLCPELEPGLFRAVFRQYNVFYLCTDTQIIVVRIIHSSRDIESIFDHG